MPGARCVLVAAAIGLAAASCTPGPAAPEGTEVGAVAPTTEAPSPSPPPPDPSVRLRRWLPLVLAHPRAVDPGAPVDLAAPIDGCPAGFAGRRGASLVVDDSPFAFFGVNVPYLVDREFPNHAVEPVVRDLSERGVQVARVWFFADDNPDRLAGVLDLGARYGLRYVVVLGDNVFKGRDWFFGDEDEEVYRPHLQRTVERFRHRPEILAWEVINEPNCGGRYDEDCVKTIRDWLTMASRMVREIDPCHLVSTGMIGAGNYEAERESYRRIHDRDAIDLLSAHRRSTESREREREIAEELDKPIYYGEVYDRGYDEGCQPLEGGAELERRAERVKDDLRDALEDGVDGYLLWDYAAGRIETDDGVRHYCGEHGFERDDPLWSKLAEAGALPAVPWRP